MPSFQYSAIDASGKKTNGYIDADSVRAARQQLRSKKIFPTEIVETSEKKKASTGDVLQYLKRDSVSTQEITIATRQLATLVNAGMPLVSALKALAEQTESVNLTRVLIDVREKVEQGSSLAKALNSHPRTFPRLYINMVESAEAAGNLASVLEKLAEHYEDQLELGRKIKSAMLYPILMLVVCGLVILIMFIFVIPKIVDMFQKQGVKLPFITRLMIFISDALISYWWVIIAVGVLTYAGIKAYYRTKKGRMKIDALKLKLPIYGPAYRKICTARVAQTLSTLLNSGVQLLAAMDICKRIVGNYVVEEALESAKDGVREGRSLAKELQKSGIFPTLLSHMIAVGEQSGELESMLEKVGKAYKTEVDTVLKGMTTIIGPIMLIVVGGLVCAIVFAILLPMLDLLDALK